MERITSFCSSDRRYGSLRVMARLCFLIGVALLAIGGALLVFGLYAWAERMTGMSSRGAAPLTAPLERAVSLFPWLGETFSLVWSFLFLLSGLQSISSGALFRLMIQLEENTRASAQILDRIQSRLESSRDGVEPLFRS
jgi:hypothetical protein